MNKIKPNTLILFFIIATIPLLSGAAQPLINGLYLFLTLLTGGIWLVLNLEELTTHKFTCRPFMVLTIIAFITLTTVNLPIHIIKAISPVRADNLLDALQTGQFINITTALSYYIPGSQFYAVYGLTLFLFFYFSSALIKSEQNQQIVLWIIAILGGLEAIHGILQSISPELEILRFPGSASPENYPTGSFSNHNHYAAFLNMCWPISLVLGLSRVKKVFERIELLKIKNKEMSIIDWIKLLVHQAILPLWCTAFIIGSIILSRSTTGILVMFFLVILCRIVIPYPRLIKIIFSGIIYSALLLYGWAMGIQGITTHITMFLHTIQVKFGYWNDTLTMLRDHPYSGIGMGAFQFMAPVYIPVPPDSLLQNHVHNDYLELALELGLPITILLFAWLLIGFFSYGRSIYKMPHKMEKMTRDEIVIIGSFYALVGFALTASANSIFHAQPLTFYAVALLAILHSIMNRKNTAEDYKPEYLFPQKKPVRFVPYRKAGRRPRR